MKRIIISLTILIIILAGIFILRSTCSSPSFTDKNDELQYLLTDLVAKDKSVKNCVLPVAKGDGSFSWSGAAGVADQKGTPMRKDTPVCIASITKMYTASVILILHEKKLLSINF